MAIQRPVLRVRAVEEDRIVAEPGFGGRNLPPELPRASPGAFLDILAVDPPTTLQLRVGLPALRPRDTAALGYDQDPSHRLIGVIGVVIGGDLVGLGIVSGVD